jgi:Zn-dependent protease with chaperone function
MSPVPDPATERESAYLLERTTVRVAGSPAVARRTLADLAGQHGVAFDAERLVGTAQTRVFTVVYRYRLRADGDGTIVTEELWLDRWWLVALVGPTVLAGLGFALPTPWAPLLLLGGTASLLQLDLAARETLVGELVPTSPTYSYRLPLTVVVAVAVALVGAATGGVVLDVAVLTTGAGLGLVALGGLVWTRYDLVVALAERVDAWAVLGAPPLRHAATTTMLVLPAVAAAVVSWAVPSAGAGHLVVWGALGVGVVAALVVVATHREFGQARAMLRQGYTEFGSPARAAGALAGAAVPGYAGAVAYVSVLGQFGGYLLAPTALPLLTVALCGLLLPGALIYGSLVAQTVGGTVGTYRLLAQSRRVALDGIDTGDADLRVADRADGFASSVDVGVARSVIVSRALYEALDDRRLKALVAHERAHLRHGDARLATVAPYLASVLLVGRNTLFSALDFRAREFRADAAAAARTSPAALVSAFETAAAVETSTSQSWTGPSSTPFVPAECEPPGWLWRYYQLFYGGFALSERHPSVAERRRAVTTTDRPPMSRDTPDDRSEPTHDWPLEEGKP